METCPCSCVWVKRFRFSVFLHHVFPVHACISVSCRAGFRCRVPACMRIAASAGTVSRCVQVGPANVPPLCSLLSAAPCAVCPDRDGERKREPSGGMPDGCTTVRGVCSLCRMRECGMACAGTGADFLFCLGRRCRGGGTVWLRACVFVPKGGAIRQGNPHAFRSPCVRVYRCRSRGVRENHRPVGQELPAADGGIETSGAPNKVRRLAVAVVYV